MRPVFARGKLRDEGLALLATLLFGCIRVYQPMSGLHGPIVVDPGAQNLGDVSLSTSGLLGIGVSLLNVSALPIVP